MTQSAKERVYEPTHEEFESLFVNNENLTQINAHLSRFNPIKVMRMEHMEIRHSAILAWLLDPRETHGWGDVFLKAFLSEALRGHMIEGGVSALDVSRYDMREALVRTEWHNIDLFILCEMSICNKPTRWIFVIENKFFSTQYEGQLSKYREKIESLYRNNRKKVDVKINGIYLTLGNEDPPKDSSFATVYYADIERLLSSLLSQLIEQTSLEVSTFIKHYINVLKEATGMSKSKSDMEKLARDIYLHHKLVLDFIIEHGVTSDFSLAARNVFGDDPEHMSLVKTEHGNFYYNHMDSSLVTFLPESWKDALDDEDENVLNWPGCENWWALYPMIVWLETRLDTGKEADGKSGQVFLYAEVGPLSNHAIRKGLIDKIKKVAVDAVDIESKKISFQKDADKDGKKYSKFLKDNTAHVDDVYDSQQVTDAMHNLLKRFSQEFKAIGDALDGYHKHGKADA